MFCGRWVLRLGLFLAAAGLARAAQPNLIYIMTDDQGAWSLGCYGNTEARTPTLDRLAAEGVRLTRAFASIPVCSPSRATFFTGRLPSQHGIHDFISRESDGPRSRYCLRSDEVLLSSILKRNGYRCGLVGKWHLGDSQHIHGGYDTWYVLPTGGGQYWDAEMYWQGEKVKAPGYLTDNLTDRAIEFIEASRDKPFFLNLEYNAPHHPLKDHPEELVAMFKDCPFDSIPKLPVHPWQTRYFDMIGNRYYLEQYFAACSGVDRGVARILKRLSELGLDENTIVIFTSDQGHCCGHHGLWGKGNASNPRNMYDTSLQIPFIVRWKGQLQAGRTSDALFGAYDLVPTVLDMLGLPPSPGRNLPGRSFAPILAGSSDAGPEAVYAEYGRARMVRTRTHKYVHRADGGPDEYYNLQVDPDEKNNLVNSPGHVRPGRDLRDRMIAWFTRYSEMGTDPIGNEYLRADDR